MLGVSEFVQPGCIIGESLPDCYFAGTPPYPRNDLYDFAMSAIMMSMHMLLHMHMLAQVYSVARFVQMGRFSDTV